MPQPGGMAAKLGDRYEGRWTLLQLLRVLNEEADSVGLDLLAGDQMLGELLSRRCPFRSLGQFSQIVGGLH